MTDLEKITSKLNHSIFEVRDRALINLISKLNHKVIHLRDIVQNKTILSQLLEWFNFPKSTRHTEILQLVLSITEIESGCANLLAIGALNFLSQLRLDLHEESKVIIDKILDKLLSSSKHSSDHNTDVTHTISRSVPDAHLFSPSIVSNYGSTIHSTFNDSYFPQSNSSINDRNKNWYEILYLPWLVLGPYDAHVLSETHKSLLSHDKATVKNNCEFITDVVFNDFPPEIFLQRPSILKCLLDHIFLTSDRTSYCSEDALHVFLSFSINLKKRLNYFSDPSFASIQSSGYAALNVYSLELSSSSNNSSKSTPNASLSESDSSRSLLGSRPTAVGKGTEQQIRLKGDGHGGYGSTTSNSSDKSNSSHHSLMKNYLNLEKSGSLTALQWALPQFATHLLQADLTFYNKMKPLSIQSCNLFSNVLNYSVHFVINAISPTIWSSVNFQAKETCSNLKKAFNSFVEVLAHLKNSYIKAIQKFISTGVFDICRVERSVYCLTSVIFLKLIESLKPPLDVISSDVLETIELIFYDVPLTFVSPDVFDSLTSIYKLWSKPFPEEYNNLRDIVDKFYDISKLLSQIYNGIFLSSYQETIEYIESSIKVIPYLRCWSLIPQVLNMISFLESRDDEEHRIFCESMYLSLLQHECREISERTYNILCDYLKEKLIDLNSEERENTVWIFKNSDILTEIVTSGLISFPEITKKIILILLQSELLVDKETWTIFATLVTPLFPYIQALSGVNDALEKLLTFADWITETYSKEEAGCYFIRQLFHNNPSVREYSETMISTIFSIPKISLSNLVMTCKTTINTAMSPNPRSESDFHRLYTLFTEESNNMYVRLAALKQIVLIIEENSFHDNFQSLGGLNRAIEIMIDSACNKKDRDEDFLQNTAKIVRIFLYNSKEIRERLSVDSSFLEALLKLATTASSFDLKSECMSCLFLVSFHAVLKIDSEFQRLQTSSLIKDNFHVPFEISVEKSKILTDLNFYELSERGQTYLKYHWMINWYGDWKSFQDTLFESPHNFVTEDLTITHLIPTQFERYIVLISGSHNSLLSLTKAITEANSHDSVITMLSCITSHLQTIVYLLSGSQNDLDAFMIAIDRFLCIPPNTEDDETLLSNIIKCLIFLLESNNNIRFFTADHFVRLFECFFKCSPNSLCNILCETESFGKASVIRRTLIKRMIRFATCFFRAVIKFDDCYLVKTFQLGSFMDKLIAWLTLPSDPHFYNLSFLQRSLSCLKILAQLPAEFCYSSCSLSNSEIHYEKCPFLSDSSSLKVSSNIRHQIINSLVDVLAKVQIGTGGLNTLFMCRGVTKSAASCLLQLLADDFSHGDLENLTFWSLESLGEEPPKALDWILPLWNHRDCEIRLIALTIISVITSNPLYCETFIQHFKAFVQGDITKILISIIDNEHEGICLKVEASKILINLVNHVDTEKEKMTKLIFEGVFSSGCFTSMIKSFSFDVGISSKGVLREITQHNISSLTFMSPRSAFQRDIHTQSHQNEYDVDSSLSPLQSSASIIKTSLPKFVTLSFVEVLCKLLECILHKFPRYFHSDNFRPQEIVQLLSNLLDIHQLKEVVQILFDSSESTGLSVSQLTWIHDLFATLTSVTSLMLTFYNVDTDSEKAYSDILTKSFGNWIMLLHCNKNIVGSIAVSFSTFYDVSLVMLSHILSNCPKVALKSTMNNPIIWVSLTMGLATNWKIAESKRNNNTLIFLAKFLDYWSESDCLLSEHLEKELPNDSRESGKADTVAVSILRWLLNIFDLQLILDNVEVIKRNGTSDEYLFHSMKKILELSLSAKRFALDQGLTASCISTIKDILRMLNFDMFHDVTSSAITPNRMSQKTLNLLSLLSKIIYLFCAFAHQSLEAKKTFVQMDVLLLLHKFWYWCMIDKVLFKSILTFVYTIVYDYVPACQNLSNAVTKSSTSPSESFLQSITKWILESVYLPFIHKSAELKDVLNLCFEIFTCCVACSRSCQLILIRSNFLSVLTNHPDRSKANKRYSIFVQSKWLNIVTALSFSNEGQCIVLAYRDSLDLVFDILKKQDETFLPKAAIIFHNLSTCSLGKKRLIANENLMTILMNNLKSDDMSIQYYMACTFWSLLYGSAKARAILSSREMVNFLTDVKQNVASKTVTQSTPAFTKELIATLSRILSVISRKNT